MIRRDYIETQSARDLYLPDPDPGSICILDIAHALSHVCRFAGHIDQFYSVAEHSICVAHILPKRFQLQGLMHDATEAYLCDIPTPFKRMIPQYADLENNLWRAISEKYGLPFELSPEVKEADRIMLLTERDALKSNSKRNWSPEYEATPRWPGFDSRPTKYVQAGHSAMAKLFIEKFVEYGGECSSLPR